MTDATRTRFHAAIQRGRNRKNWSKQWTHEKYGVAEAVAPLIEDGLSLECANDELALEGFEPLGPDCRPFVWGPITAIHRIGGHAIVEYTTTDSFLAGEGKMGGGGRRSFSVYTTIGGNMRSTSHSFSSLDAAVLHAIVYAAEARAHGINAGANERLTGYLLRILAL
jgi:hypothetical protein